jgi:F-type H+-transporting ATPase subunit epsilon
MFNLSIVTAEGLLYQGDIEMLVAPSVDGELGILTNHHPLVTKLGPGAMRVVKTDKTEQILFVNGG